MPLGTSILVFVLVSLDSEAVGDDGVLSLADGFGSTFGVSTVISTGATCGVSTVGVTGTFIWLTGLIGLTGLLTFIGLLVVI